MKWMRCLVAVLAVMFLRTEVFADDPGRWYVAVKAGSYHPDTSNDGIVKKLDAGFIGEIGAGYLVTRNLAVEAGFMTCKAEQTLPAADVAESTIRGVSAAAFLLTLRGVLPLANDRVEISAGAGIGSYQLDVEIKDPPPPPVNRTESRSETGYHFTVGADYNVTRRIALGLEYKWFSVKPESTELGGDALSLGVRYRF